MTKIVSRSGRLVYDLDFMVIEHIGCDLDPLHVGRHDAPSQSKKKPLPDHAGSRFLPRWMVKGSRRTWSGRGSWTLP